MTSFDDLDAPQFSTFEDFEQENAEQYFEIDHESERMKTMEDNEPMDTSVEECFYSPLCRNTNSSEETSSTNILELRSRKVKRSLSSGNIEIPVENLANLRLEEEKPKVKDDFEYGKLRKGNTASQSKLKFCSQESLNRLAAPKKIYSSNGNLAHGSQEYVSVAEAVRKFHEKTPNRYHSQNKNSSAPKNVMPVKLKATIPISPRLLTKKRVKMNEHVMSHEDKLQKEFQEQQKFRIKAHPVNKKILQPMKALPKEKKQPTVVEPFKLTEVEHKKISSPKKAEYHFHARPIPKSVIEAPKLPKKQEIKVTQPVTPSFIKKIPKASPVKKNTDKPNTVTLKTTRPEPFSFEKRDMKLMKKREELVKKTLEEEKQARQFHARPIPKPIISMITKIKQKSHNGSASSLNQGDNVKAEHEDHFKARPPTVLYQKPFEPKKLEHPLTEIQPFNFNSDVRAMERHKFEQKKREQEELAARLIKEDEEEKLRQEEEERRRIREETKFKAQPVHKFKGVILKPSGKVTEPISPVFLSGKSRKNKENEQH